MSCLRANDCGPTFHVAGGQKTKIHHVSVNINFFTFIELLLVNDRNGILPKPNRNRNMTLVKKVTPTVKKYFPLSYEPFLYFS